MARKDSSSSDHHAWSGLDLAPESPSWSRLRLPIPTRANGSGEIITGSGGVNEGKARQGKAGQGRAGQGKAGLKALQKIKYKI
ncbi:B3 domain-containing protein REM14 [Frankliniella fusca]|uniref:B3 domain-containing protein REM14 n=1 Tax=Frankliniella fusca TaxID=407009 RepID=A0AAE1HXB3_9NEOP|nr:B3 domain-containing protein REM14 [Frankliniella fusca]